MSQFNADATKDLNHYLVGQGALGRIDMLGTGGYRGEEYLRDSPFDPSPMPLLTDPRFESLLQVVELMAWGFSQMAPNHIEYLHASRAEVGGVLGRDPEDAGG